MLNLQARVDTRESLAPRRGGPVADAPARNDSLRPESPCLSGSSQIAEFRMTAAFGRRLTVGKELRRSLTVRTSVALARFLIYGEVRAAERITDVRDTLLDERRFA
jgi:hypothetical protein